jgi:hypothetical protein
VARGLLGLLFWESRMPVPDFAHGIQISFLDTAGRARTHAGAQSSAAASGTANTAVAANTRPASDPPLTFDDLLDVMNPLQHLPIVSTLYRHFTHDEINPLPKIAGDALYGGWMGLASSVADYAFEKITGKDFGDTVLALVAGDDKPPVGVASATRQASAALASAAPGGGQMAAPTVKPSATPTPSAKLAAAERLPLPLSGAAQPIPTLDAATLDAFMTAVNSKGLPGDLGQRTLEAYRRTVAAQSRAPTASAAVH